LLQLQSVSANALVPRQALQMASPGIEDEIDHRIISTQNEFKLIITINNLATMKCIIELMQ